LFRLLLPLCFWAFMNGLKISKNHKENIMSILKSGQKWIEMKVFTLLWIKELLKKLKGILCLLSLWGILWKGNLFQMVYFYGKLHHFALKDILHVLKGQVQLQLIRSWLSLLCAKIINSGSSLFSRFASAYDDKVTRGSQDQLRRVRNA